jgi:hypothetical protein
MFIMLTLQNFNRDVHNTASDRVPEKSSTKKGAPESAPKRHSVLTPRDGLITPR